MDEERIVYLTSSGSKELYAQNSASKFTNKLASPILLDSNTKYEVGLVSILYPDQYYAVLADNDAYNMELVILQEDNNIDLPSVKSSNLVIKTSKNILAGNIEKIVRMVNEDLIQKAKEHFSNFFPQLFSKRLGIIRWNDEESKVEILCMTGDQRDGATGGYINVSLKFSPGLATIFGFRTEVLYDVYTVHGSKKVYHKSPIPPSPRCGVDYLYLYTDIIQPSNFGGQLVNILDCFALQNGGSKGIHNSIYKSLNTTFIDQISLYVTDQNGRSINFAEESTLTCALHIRPK